MFGRVFGDAGRNNIGKIGFIEQFFGFRVLENIFFSRRFDFRFPNVFSPSEIFSQFQIHRKRRKLPVVQLFRSLGKTYYQLSVINYQLLNEFSAF